MRCLFVLVIGVAISSGVASREGPISLMLFEEDGESLTVIVDVEPSLFDRTDKGKSGSIKLLKRGGNGALVDLSVEIEAKAGTQVFDIVPGPDATAVVARWVADGTLHAVSSAEISSAIQKGVTVEGWYGFGPESGMLLPDKERGLISVSDVAFWDDGSGPALVAVGSFEGRIARWDGVAWNTLGEGLDGSVNEVEVDEHGNLLVAGSIRVPGSTVSTGIVRWDGESWSEFGGGVSGAVFDLVVDDATGHVVIGGIFGMAGGVRVSNIALWNGSEWDSLSRGIDSFVFAADFDGFGGIYAGGRFTMAGGQAANNIAYWDGVKWRDLGGGVDDEVDALAVDQDGALYVGGDFENAGGIPASVLAKWDGGSWTAVDVSPVELGFVHTLFVDSSGALLVGGIYYSGQTIDVEGIASWDGSMWSGLGLEYGGGVSRIVPAPSGGYVLAGSFSSRGFSTYVIEGSLDNWLPLGKPTNGSVSALVSDGGGFFAGGSFTQIEKVPANHLAYWDGETWSALGEGVNDQVRAMDLASDGSLYVGGHFSTAGGVPASAIARWDGASWSSLGAGLTGGQTLQPIVYAVTVSEAGDVFVAGTFEMAGAVASPGVARWDGNQWHTVPANLPGNIYALAVDTRDRLILGGEFDAIGGVAAKNIAAWDGTTFSPLGGGREDTVRALYVDSQANILAGTFSFSSVEQHGIASWDGAEWSLPGGGVHEPVLAIAEDLGKNIVISGLDFGELGNAPSRYVARLEGANWVSLENGFGAVSALTLGPNGDLVTGGTFRDAGGRSHSVVAGYGTLESTETEIVSIFPLVTGVPTVLIAEVSSSVAPPSGRVTFAGTPGGQCTDIELTPLDSTTSRAVCEITYTRNDTYQVAATFAGGINGSGKYSASTSSQISVSISDTWFADSFEGP